MSMLSRQQQEEEEEEEPEEKEIKTKIDEIDILLEQLRRRKRVIWSKLRVPPKGENFEKSLSIDKKYSDSRLDFSLS